MSKHVNNMKQDPDLTKRNTSNNSSTSTSPVKSKNQNDEKSKKGVTNQNVTWGRSDESNWFMAISAGLMMVSVAILIQYVWAACTHFECNMVGPISFVFESKDIFEAIWHLCPKYSHRATLLYVFWILFQAFLYQVLPGMIGYGQTTPAGYTLPYKCNGLNAYILTHVLYGVLSLGFGLFSAAIIEEEHGGFLVITQIYGNLLAVYSYLKAHFSPTHADDRKFSGSILYDFFMGIEMNPRIGKMFDQKLYHNGRPGIIAWTLIDLSFMAAQYNKYGYVTNSMILVTLFHATYVVDFFYNEDWYLRTIDIAHDHFGWYLCYGDTVFLPFMYNVQSHYLLRHPVHLSNLQVAVVLSVAALGYAIFRAANHQKDIARTTGGKCNIWGKPAKYVEAYFMSGDGKQHKSILLCSGFWGISRHFNYVGDMIFAFSMCLACWTLSFVSYLYFFILAAILIHRIQRDHCRCLGKYGKYWQEYCKQVQYKLVPFVY